MKTATAMVGRAWWTVGLLSLLYVLSFIDRLILALLVSPLKADLGVSDLQLGLLFGPAFGLFYAAIGLPLARLADRGNRRILVVCGVLLWGAATVLSGFAGSFALLVALRIGLAIGEAALTPAAHSMIGDLFPPQRRSLAASIYSAVGQGGAYAGFILGAAVVRGMEAMLPGSGDYRFSAWQLTLFAVGIPSIVVALVFAFTTREPPRLGAKAAATLGEVRAYLRQHVRLYAGLLAGAGLLQAIPYAWTAWAPEYMRRNLDVTIQQAGTSFGVVGLIAAFAGSVAFPLLTRRLEHAGRPDALAQVSMLGVIGGSVLTWLAVQQSQVEPFLALLGLSMFFTQGGSINVLVGMQVLAPPHMRATLVASVLLSITLLGMCIGPPVSAAIAARLSATGEGLGEGIGVLAALLAIPCLALLAMTRRGLRERNAGELVTAASQ